MLVFSVDYYFFKSYFNLHVYVFWFECAKLIFFWFHYLCSHPFKTGHGGLYHEG